MFREQCPVCEGWARRLPGAVRPCAASEDRMRGASASSHGQWGTTGKFEGIYAHLDMLQRQLSPEEWVSLSKSCLYGSEWPTELFCLLAGLGCSKKALQATCLALPPRVHTWEQLLTQGAATLPFTGSQLCGRVELL